MTELPQGWSSVPLGELVEATRPRVNPRDADGLLFIGMDHVESETMRLLGTVPASTMKSAAVHFQAGDVLYGRLRPYLNKVYRPDFVGLASAEFIALVPSTRLDGDFLRYLLNSAHFVRFAMTLTTGDRPRVDFKQIGDYPVPLPELEEQRSIVAAIEQSLTRVDAGSSALWSASQKLKLVERAIANAATHAEAMKGASRANPPAGLPHGWRWLAVKEMATREKHALAIGPFGSNLKVVDYRSSGVPLVFVRNVRSGKFLDEHTKFVSVQKADELRPHLVRAGDVLVTKMGAPPGDAVVYPANLPPAVVTADVVKLTVDGVIADPRFIALAINSSVVRSQVAAITQGVAQRKISLGRFRSVHLPLPPIDEQRRIVERADAALSLLEAATDEVSRNILRASALREAILLKAYSGSLHGAGDLS